MEEKKVIKINLLTLFLIIALIIVLTAVITVGVMNKSTENKRQQLNSNIVVSEKKDNQKAEMEEFKQEINKENNEDLLYFVSTKNEQIYSNKLTLEYIGEEQDELTIIKEHDNGNKEKTEYLIKTNNEINEYGPCSALTRISIDKNKLFICPMFAHDDKSILKARSYEIYEVSNINGKIKEVVVTFGDVADATNIYILMENGSILKVDWINGILSGNFVAYDIETEIKVSNIYGAMETFYDLTGNNGDYGGMWNHVLILKGEDGKYYRVYEQ